MSKEIKTDVKNIRLGDTVRTLPSNVTYKAELHTEKEMAQIMNGEIPDSCIVEMELYMVIGYLESLKDYTGDYIIQDDKIFEVLRK